MSTADERHGSGRWLLVGAVCLAALALLEVSAGILLWTSPPGFRSRAELRASLLATNEGDDAGTGKADAWRPSHVLHPYIGFVFDADAPRHQLNGRPVALPVNELGFFGPPPPRTPDEERVVIALAGGSVAAELFAFGQEPLRRALADLPGFEGREVMLVSLAVDGMKQPQQLLALTYLLARGAHFDVVINLDGFNEAVLPGVDNDLLGVATSFPRNWRRYAAKGFDPEVARRMAELVTSRDDLAAWRARFATPPCPTSNLCLAVWHGVERRLDNRRRTRDEAMADAMKRRDAVRARATTFQQRGPRIRYEPDLDADARGAAIIAERARLWTESSLQMHRVSAANGVAYLHLLQPSQYLDGGKPFTEQELENAVKPGQPFGMIATRAYPTFVDAGRATLESGPVDYGDLTRVFEGDTRTLYRDACCHLTDEGQAALADAIGSHVQARLRAQQR